MALTVYLIGAGLTKSLELDRPVPLMTDFVHVMTHYVHAGSVLGTLVGLELGRVYREPCEECWQLATRLHKGDIPKATPEERASFAQRVRCRPPESIEDLLKSASLKAQTPTREATWPFEAALASGLEDSYFRYAINEVFFEIGWNLRLDLLESFLKRQFKDDRRSHAFVSFNYDLALDRAIERASGDEWQPRDGYGFEFPCYTTDDAKPHSTQMLARSSRRIKILKPHGSLNWLVRRKNHSAAQQGFAEPEGMLLPLDSDRRLRNRPTRMPFDFEILVAPPLSTKRKIMEGTVAAEAEAIKQADEVFVIGYSLPETDGEQWDLIRRAVEDPRSVAKRLTVVNYRERSDYFDRIRRVFSVTFAQEFNCGFREFALRASGG